MDICASYRKINGTINNGFTNIEQWMKQNTCQMDHMTGINMDARTMLFINVEEKKNEQK